MRTISSQRFRHPAIVAEKRAAADYCVSYVTVEVDGEEFRVIVDGHHSHSAALSDGVAPEWTCSTDMQREADADAVAFLDRHHMGDDYHDVETGFPVW